MYVKVRSANGILSTLLVSLSDKYTSQTSGLMGNYNGDQLDDLIPCGSNRSISLMSNLQSIHYTFGNSCKLVKVCINSVLWLYISVFILYLNRGSGDWEHPQVKLLAFLLKLALMWAITGLFYKMLPGSS